MILEPTLLWQLADSAFPAGGFAHSGGLEASLHLGEVRDVEEWRRLAADVVAQAGRGALPLVTSAHDEPAALPRLDALCDAFLSNPVANRASRAQGRALVSSAARSFPRESLDALRDAVRAPDACAHQAPVFGAVMRALHVDRRSTQRLFLFLTSRGVVSAAVRLGLAGVWEAQQLQAALSVDIEETLTRCQDLGPDDLAQTTPLVDLFQSLHDRLYSKLFQS